MCQRAVNSCGCCVRVGSGCIGYEPANGQALLEKDEASHGMAWITLLLSATFFPGTEEHDLVGVGSGEIGIGCSPYPRVPAPSL